MALLYGSTDEQRVVKLGRMVTSVVYGSKVAMDVSGSEGPSKETRTRRNTITSVRNVLTGCGLLACVLLGARITMISSQSDDSTGAGTRPSVHTAVKVGSLAPCLLPPPVAYY